MTALTRLYMSPTFAIALGICTGLETFASSFTLINGEGFESPEYSVGLLEGQFASTFEGVGSAAWVQSPLAGTSTADVQSTVFAPGGGSQAVEVNRAAGSDDRWAVPITGAPSLDMPLVCIEWDMLVEESVGPQPFGPFFGIEAYDDDAASILRVGSLGVDASTGDVLYTLRDDGVLPGFLLETGATVDFGVWNSFRMVLDYSTDTYFMFLNDESILSAPFEQDGADQFTDADIAAIAASFDPDSVAATGVAFFDNYRVFETNDFSKIPEPASVVMIMLATQMLPWMRR